MYIYLINNSSVTLKIKKNIINEYLYITLLKFKKKTVYGYTKNHTTPFTYNHL